MKRTNVWMLAVLISPLVALVGCPKADTDKPDANQPKAAQADSSATDKSSTEKKQGSETDGGEKTASGGSENGTGEHASSDDKKGDESEDEQPLPEIFRGWPKPKVAIVISANQDGYIEPCGCIGLKNQKGGLSRRATFLKELRDKGWPLLLVDGGGLVRRYGPQAVLKYRTVIDMLGKLGYDAIA
ncbi:MAG: hypothetical protein MI757_21665, partial [Pirellulales bacterium]|nr:hypothetical protein [Pirellulales bacterium]